MVDFDLKGVVGKNTTPAARISSAVISLVMLYLIHQNTFPELNLGLFLFLSFHLISQLISGLIENQKYACHKCGKTLKVVGHKFEEHECL